MVVGAVQLTDLPAPTILDFPSPKKKLEWCGRETEKLLKWGGGCCGAFGCCQKEAYGLHGPCVGLCWPVCCR